MGRILFNSSEDDKIYINAVKDYFKETYNIKLNTSQVLHQALSTYVEFCLGIRFGK